MATGTISGTIKVGTEAGAPASNSIVRAYDRITGILVTEVTADVNGEFSLVVPDDSRKYTLTAINNSFPGYNAGIDDNKSAITVVDTTNPITLYLKPTKSPSIFIEQFVSGRGKYRSWNNVDASGSGTFFTIKKPNAGIAGNSAVIKGNSTINYATRPFGEKIQWDTINFYFKINTTQVTTIVGPRIIFYSEIDVPGNAWHVVEFIPRVGSAGNYRPFIGRQVDRGVMAYQSGSAFLGIGVWYFCNIRINPFSGALNATIWPIYDRAATIATFPSPGTDTTLKAELAAITFFTPANSTVEIEVANIQIVDSQGFFLNLHPQHLKPNN